MPKTNMTTDVEKYRANLYDINKRTEVISEHISGFRKTKYIITEVEFLCLQFRKILELIALSSLIANKNEYSKQHEKFAKHYNARLILQDLERINSNFYPRPFKQIVSEINGQKIIDLQPVTEGYLTKDEFLRIYELCGGMMHAENPYGQKRDIDMFNKEFPSWLNKIVILLNHHNITLVDNETMIIGLMKSENDGLTGAHLFKVVKGHEESEFRRRSGE